MVLFSFVLMHTEFSLLPQNTILILGITSQLRGKFNCACNWFCVQINRLSVDFAMQYCCITILNNNSRTKYVRGYMDVWQVKSASLTRCQHLAIISNGQLCSWYVVWKSVTPAIRKSDAFRRKLALLIREEGVHCSVQRGSVTALSLQHRPPRPPSG